MKTLPPKGDEILAKAEIIPLIVVFGQLLGPETSRVKGPSKHPHPHNKLRTVNCASKKSKASVIKEKNLKLNTYNGSSRLEKTSKTWFLSVRRCKGIPPLST